MCQQRVPLFEDDRLYDIGRFAPNARQLCQFFQVGRYFSVEFLHQHLRHPHQVFGFVVGITHGAYVVVHHLWRGGRQGFWRWKISKEARRHLVDALVCTLGGKNDRNEQLVGRRKSSSVSVALMFSWK